MTNKIGVGIIGASGWGGIAHIPALQALPNFEVTAVSTTRPESANEVARLHRIPHAFTSAIELSKQPDVDIVVITVKVPEHDNLVRTAINAGKHIFCEWPIGVSTQEAEGLLTLADEKGVRHIVGLQARANPAVNYVKDLVASGYVGQVKAVNVNYTMPSFPTVGETIDQSHVYLLNKNNGANQLTITAGHLLDGITYMLKPFTEISAILETQIKKAKVIESGEWVQATAPDHVIVNGILENGAIASCHIRNANHAGLMIEINGTEGDLLMLSKDKLMFQMDSFIVKGSQGKNNEFELLTVPKQYHWVPSELSGPAFNIAQLYTQFSNNLRKNNCDTPDFHTGIQLHTLIDHIWNAAESGIRQTVI